MRTNDDITNYNDARMRVAVAIPGVAFPTADSLVTRRFKRS
jgi:hypothetical protein